MNTKTSIFRLAVAAVILGAILLVSLIVPGSTPSEAGDMRFRFASSERLAGADSISIEAGTFVARFERREGEWVLVVNGNVLPVKKGRVARLLEELANPGRVDEIASGRSQAESLGLDPANAWKLVVASSSSQAEREAGENAAVVIVELGFGFTDDTGDRVYMSIAGDPKLYRTGTGLFRLLGKKAADWLDTAVLDVGTLDSGIQSVEVSWIRNRPAGTIDSYSILRNGDEWTFATSEHALPERLIAAEESPESAAARIVSSILSMEASGFVAAPPHSATPREFSEGRILLHRGDGASPRLEISGSPDGTKVFVRVGEREWIHVVPAEMLSDIMPGFAPFAGTSER